MLWTCEIQDAQFMISIGKLRFSSCLGAKVRCQGPPGTAKAQLCFKWLQIQQFFCLYKHSLTPSKVLCETHMRKVHFIEKWCRAKSVSRKIGVGVPWLFACSLRMLMHVVSFVSLNELLAYCFHDSKII